MKFLLILLLVELFPGGDFEHWTVRPIKQSAIVGGGIVNLYVVGGNDTIRGNKPYEYGKNGNFWASSNAYANIVGIEKAAVSVRPEKREGGGTCCRMETILQHVEVMGMDLKVVAKGSIFTGTMTDPITLECASKPMANINQGKPFTKRPKAIVLDYKALISDSREMVYANTKSKVKRVKGHDEGEILMVLQQRWEDSKGRIHARRVGTASLRITANVPEWQNGVRIPVRYGNLSKDKDLKPYERLFDDKKWMARNSQGKMVWIEEDEWAPADAVPTHIILQLGSGCQGAYTGTPGNILWVDNLGLEY